MKKVILLAVLVLASFSFAIKYTGNVYLNASYSPMYLSVGCSEKDTSGLVKTIGNNVVRLTTRDQYYWYKIPVKTLLQKDTLSPFCFYKTVRDSMRVYDEDEGVYRYEKYYPSSAKFSISSFKNQEDLYIDFDSNKLYYKNLNLPTVFYQSDWIKNYVVLDGNVFKEITNKKDGWFVVHNELKNMYLRYKTDSVQTMKYTTSLHCLEDERGRCIVDNDGSSIMVRDTVDSTAVWTLVRDSLTVDSIFSEVSNISFAETNLQCGGRYTYKTLFSVGGMLSDGGQYYCLKSDQGIELKDSIYIFENPKKKYETLIRNKKPEPAKKLYVLPPQIAKWFGENPLLSTDGGKTGTVLYPVGEYCGWFSEIFFEETIPNKVSFYGATSKGVVVGDNTNLDSLYKALKTDVLYFVANDPAKKFWYKEKPEYDGICYVNLYGIVYDTDAELHPSFSCYSEGGEACQQGAQGVELKTALTAVNSCIGLTPGIVEDTLGKNGKPVLSNSGKKCFIDAKYFNQLFNSTEGVNETSCTSIPFSMNAYGKWEFASDYYMSPGTKVVGGYYPVEKTADEDIVVGSPLVEARTKRLAEGPVFVGPHLRAVDTTEGVMKMNLLCNGSAWDKGRDCSGLFTDGDDLGMSGILEGFLDITLGKGLSYSDVCVWGWSCPSLAPEGWPIFKNGSEQQIGNISGNASNMNGDVRWYSDAKAGRNQHFCFESHARFTYKKGLRFGVRGDDDIWIFVGGRLVIDLGGTHLAAPGYADLDQVKDKDGKDLVVGKEYDLDIFFCDRRTTMSNMNFYSNIYLDQSNVTEKMSPCKAKAQHIFDDDSLNQRTPIVANKVPVLPKLGAVVQGRMAYVSGVRPGSKLVIMDLQGRIVGGYTAVSSNVTVSVKNAGRYILKTETGFTSVNFR